MVYDVVPRQRQKEAMAWLSREVFEAPVWLNDPGILARIGPSTGGLRAVQGRQATSLNRLLDPRPMDILSEMEATQPDNAYPLVEFLDDVRDGVWGNVRTASAIDGYRRALQRSYVERMAFLMTEQPEAGRHERQQPFEKGVGWSESERCDGRDRHVEGVAERLVHQAPHHEQ